ncbi:MAG: M24 family metallopeptidase [Gammaproteobacteria bacterium]|nr:M24 family metallopeptidase [Gammaproteobacteria bacterium]
MLDQARQRTREFQSRPGDAGIDLAILTDESSIAYLAGFWGYETGYRTGRSIGMAYLESPELKHGDKTILQEGMTFAVDDGISVDGRLGGRIGDSIAVTAEGSEYITEFPRKNSYRQSITRSRT